jgi:hypothetical protein
MKASMAFDQKKTELVDELSKKEVRVRTVSQLPPVFHSSHFLISFFASVSVNPNTTFPTYSRILQHITPT